MKKVSFNFDKVKEVFGSLQQKLLKRVKQAGNTKKTSKSSFDLQVIWDFLISLTTPEKRMLIHKGFIVSLFATTSYYTGKGLSSFIQDKVAPKQGTKKAAYRPPSTPERLSTRDIAVIKDKNLFHTKLKDKEFKNLVKKPVLNLDKECKRAERKSSLGIKLLTTTVLQDSVKSIASVQVRGGKSVNVREGDKIQSMAKVSRIDRLYMILKNLKTGDCEYVQRKGVQTHKKLTILNPSLGKKVMNKVMKQGIKNVGNHFTIKKSVKDKMLNNISKVLTQAKAIPIRSPDGNMNFKITEIEPGSIYSQLNIQNGDVITRINGKPIQGINEVMNMFGSFREMSNLSLSIKRNGEEENLDYQFE